MGEPGTFLYEAWIARYALLKGMAVTAEMSVIVIIIGTFIGLIGGLCLQYAIAPLRWLVRAYVDILRGIPVLVLILFTFYGLSLFNISIPAFGAGVVALAAFCGAHMSEVVRGAISSIPHAQTEAAKALGLGFWKRFRFVILPQATRRMLPPAINTAVEIVKSTTLLSVIGVVELLLATQQTIARNYLVIQFYLAACVLYLIINFTISQLGALVERRFAYIKY